MSKTLLLNASRGDKCRFLHLQEHEGGSPDEEADDSDDDENHEDAMARRQSRQDPDNHKDPGNSGAASSWE